MNRVTLVGRITRDPELRTSPNNVSFVAFTVAINRIGTSSSGEREADFINCVAFNKQAENLARFIKKGGMIGVEGKLQTRRYTAQDGSNRTATEVICDFVHFLEPKSSANQAGGYHDYSSYETPSYQGYNPQPSMPSYNNAPVNNYQPSNQFNQPKSSQPEKVDDPFDDVKKQFDISDDDLPF